MKKYQVVGIGNAVVDIITQSSDKFLNEMAIEKGVMQLIDRDRAEMLYASMDQSVETPGGAVANSIAGLGAMGVRTAFIGRVCNDVLGKFYATAMQKSGTDFVNFPIEGGELPTSRSMIFISEDGERSMNTYLGISAELGLQDIPLEIAAQADVVFLEGYLFDKDKGKEAFKYLAKACRAAGGKAGIAISDPFCVERHRPDFLRLIKNDLDYVIGNEEEIKSLFETNDLNLSMLQLSEICDLVICTRDKAGVSVMHENDRIDVPVQPIIPVDATGAGDQFAAGFLFGLVNGRDLKTCCVMGNIAAKEVIGHIGPRPIENVSDLFSAAGIG